MVSLVYDYFKNKTTPCSMGKALDNFISVHGETILHSDRALALFAILASDARRLPGLADNFYGMALDKYSTFYGLYIPLSILSASSLHKACIYSALFESDIVIMAKRHEEEKGPLPTLQSDTSGRYLPFADHVYDITTKTSMSYRKAHAKGLYFTKKNPVHPNIAACLDIRPVCSFLANNPKICQNLYEKLLITEKPQELNDDILAALWAAVRHTAILPEQKEGGTHV